MFKVLAKNAAPGKYKTVTGDIIYVNKYQPLLAMGKIAYSVPGEHTKDPFWMNKNTILEKVPDTLRFPRVYID